MCYVFAYDPAKDKLNLKKHGLSLAEAARIEWDTVYTWMDKRTEYGELRHRGIGFIGDRLYFVAFTLRGDHKRIISLRKANRREAKFYAQHNQN
jgi:uncharacterized DUF497 family protein